MQGEMMSGKSYFEVALDRLNELLNSGKYPVKMLVLQYKNAEQMAEREGSAGSKERLAEAGKKLLIPAMDEISRCLENEEKGLGMAAWLATQVVALWTTANLGGRYEKLPGKVFSGLEESLKKTDDDSLTRACLWFSLAKMLLYTGVSGEKDRLIAAKQALKSRIVDKALEYLDKGGRENEGKAACFAEQATLLSMFALPGEEAGQAADNEDARLQRAFDTLL